MLHKKYARQKFIGNSDFVAFKSQICLLQYQEPWSNQGSVASGPRMLEDAERTVSH